MPGPATPPGSTPAGPRTAPKATATHTADHHNPGPGRRIFISIRAVSSRTSAFRPISTPTASCSAEARLAVGSF